MTTAPHGSWQSPIGIEQVLGASVGLSSIGRLGDGVGWLEARPGQNGRVTLVQGERELTPAPTTVRSRVMEYGGGAWHGDGNLVAWCDDSTRRVWVSELDPNGQASAPRPITPDDPDLRYGDLRVHADLGLVLAVREDHRGHGEARTEIVSLDLAGTNPDGGTVLQIGADFYANPELSTPPAGSPDERRLAWFEWQHPNMPWDHTTLATVACDGQRCTGETTVVAKDCSAIHPQWGPGGELFHLDDATGFWNPRRTLPGETPATAPAIEADFGRPVWVLGNARYAGVDGHRLLVSAYRDGLATIGIVDADDNSLVELPETFADVDSLCVAGGAGWAIVNHQDRPAEVLQIDLDTLATTVVRSAGEAPDPAWLPVAESIWFDGPHGASQAWWYPPTNPDFTAPDGERPPVIVSTHGGPTGMTISALSMAIAYWTSRGFGYLDVNYSGSAGFGREYRNRLHGNWGIADVDDAVAAVRSVVDRGLADPARVVIRGGSAGGYTTLQALVSSDVFAAGVSSYGIGDLEMLATDTHKFESRYLDLLVGPYPAERDRYLARSPIHHVDRLSSPMLILQGRDDKVVPPNQAEAMADAVRAKGLPVALVMFDGEGHGFRQESTRRAVLEAQQSFFAQLFGYTPADDVPQLKVENLQR